jgi:sugar phosphate isomerase/epimerase
VYLGYSTWGMPTVPIDVAVARIAQLGFDGLELTVIPRWLTEISTLGADERRHIRQLYSDYNLVLPAVAGHTALLEADPARHAANMERLCRTADLCCELTLGGSIPALNTTVGGRSDDWERRRHELAERAGVLATYAGNQGVTLALEPHVNTALDRPERVVWLIEQVDSPYCRVNFDISHFNIIGLSVEETVAVLAPLAVHTHVKDERGRAPDHEFLIPGEGEFDYVRYLKAMAAAGYDGFITVEISVMVQRRPQYDPLAAAARAYSVLSRAFEEAGLPRPARPT